MKSKEGSHHHKHDEKKRWESIPLGIRILIVYTIALAFFYLLFGITIPTNVFFGVITFGAYARILNLVFLSVLVAVIIGLSMKKHWAGKLAFAFFAFEIVNLAVSFIMRYDVMKHIFIIITSVAVVLLNSLILWYLWEKRLYFKDERHFKQGKADRIFITSITILASLFVISTLIYSAVLYNTTIAVTNRIISQMNGMSREEAMFECTSYYGDEKDICYLVLASAYDVPAELCDEVGSTFYRMACIQAVML